MFTKPAASAGLWMCCKLSVYQGLHQGLGASVMDEEGSGVQVMTWSCSMLALLATQCRCLKFPEVPCGDCGREADGSGPGEEKAEAQEASSRIRGLGQGRILVNAVLASGY